jgi:hypothetical protein
MAHLCIIKEKLSYLSLLKHPIVIDILFLLCYYSSLHLSSARSIRCFFSGSDASILHFYSLLESYILASRMDGIVRRISSTQAAVHQDGFRLR